MELSPTVEFMLYVGGGVILFIAWIVTLADILHQGGVTAADRLLWVPLVTLVPVLGIIVYWIMAGRITDADPTSNTSRRARRSNTNDSAHRGEETHR